MTKLNLKMIRDDIALCFAFLTRVPITRELPTDRRLMEAALGFPIVGLIIGIVSALVYYCASIVGLPPMAAAFLALAASAIITGGLHEDGLADVADGFGGGKSIERKIEIMRDSHIGAYGTLALILVTGLKVSAISAVGDSDLAVGLLIAGHTWSRVAIIAVALLADPASDIGSGHGAGKPNVETLAYAAAIAFAVSVLALPVPAALASVLAAGIAVITISWLAKWQIGGYTGDVLGASEQVAGTLTFLAIAIAVS